MFDFLELDVQSVQKRLRETPSLAGQIVLGPKERLFGSINHEFIRIGDGIILQRQLFRFKGSYTLRTFRPRFVVFQFTKIGSYFNSINENANHICTASLHVTNYADTMSFVSPQDECLQGVALFVERELLPDSMGLIVDGLREPYRSIFTSPFGATRALRMPLQAKIWLSVDDILRCEFPEPTRTNYLRSKALEILCLAIHQINSLSPRDNVLELSAEQRRLQQVEAVAEIYRRDVNHVPKIADLSERVGLNRNILISEFTKQYGMTPYKYSMKVRMEKALEQIEQGQISLSSIASNTGYENYAAFSRAYSAYFGHSPSDVRSCFVKK